VTINPKNSLINGLRPGMDVGGVQLKLAEPGRGGVVVVVIVVVVVVVGLCSAAAAVSVHVKIVVGQQQFGGIEDHVVDDVLRTGDVGRHRPVGADKVHRHVVVHADRRRRHRAALEARRVRRRRRGRQLSVVIHVLHRHRVHQIQRLRAVLGLDGGVLQLLPGVVVVVVVVADAVATRLHLKALLMLGLLLVIVVVVHRGRLMVFDGLVVLPTDAADVVAAALPRALVYGAAAQVQHGRRRTLVVSRRSGGRVLSGWPLVVDPLQLEHVVVVGGGRLLHRLTVDGRRRLRPGHEPEVGGGHVLNDRRRRRRIGLKLLQDLIVLQPGRCRPVLMLVMLIIFTAAATAAVVVVVTMVMMVVVLGGVGGLLMLEHGSRGFWPGCRQAAVVANTIIRKTRATGIYKVIK